MLDCSGKHLHLHSSGQERVTEQLKLKSPPLTQMWNQSSVPLARPEKSQRKSRNQFKQSYFYVLRTCRFIHIDYLNIANYMFFHDMLHVLAFTQIASHTSSQHKLSRMFLQIKAMDFL